MGRCKFLFTLLAVLLLLTSCHKQVQKPQSRYYGESYNFIVKADSMLLLRFLPSEASLYQDTLFLREGDRVAVSDILTKDSLQILADTTWVQLLKDDATFGWVEEMSMREQVVPDDPISKAISMFSDNHRMIFLVIIIIMLITYLLRYQYKRGAPMVHFNDIPSSYPAVLCVLMAISASLYASIQMFDVDDWQQYYYNPTLNPLEEHDLIRWFLFSVWIIVIMLIACVSEVKKHLKTSETILYLLGLLAMCAANYIVFSQLTLYYIGYPLLAVYVVFAIYMRFRKNRKGV